MKLFVGNLPYTTQSTDLQDLFNEFGNVTDVFIPLDRETRRPRGFAFVTFESSESAEAALEELNGAEYEGRELRISIAQDRDERPQRRGDGPRPERSDRGGPDRERGNRGDRHERGRGDRGDRGGRGGFDRDRGDRGYDRGDRY